MKKLVLVSLITLTSFAVFAQKEEKGISYGVKTGIAFPHLSFSNENTDVITSFYVGGMVNFPVSSFKNGTLSVQPGLTFINKGGQESVVNFFSGQKINRTYKTSYLEIPVNLVAHLHAGEGKFFVGAGPYLAFALSSKQTETMKGISVSTDMSSQVKTADLGFNFLLGYQIKNGLSINGGYGLGLTNILKNEGTAKNRVLSIGLGYSF